MLRRLIMLAILLAIAAAFYYYYRIYLPGSGTDMEYMLIEAVQRDLYSAVSATGKIAVTDESSIYLKTSQRVETVHVKEGDRVNAGQILITYDIASELKSLEHKRQIAQINRLNAELGAQKIALPAAGNELLSYNADVNSARKSIRDSQNSIDSIKIRISQQQIRVSDAESQMDKNIELFDQGYLTKEEYDLSVSSYKSASESLNDLMITLDGEEQNLSYRQSQLSNAEQKLANVKNSLNDESSRLMYEQQLNIAELSGIEIEQIEDEMNNFTEYTISPIKGIVSYIGVVEGSTATRSNPVIRLSDPSTMAVTADISQYDAPRLAIGQKADVFIAGLPEKPYYGVVKKISASSIEKVSGSEKEVIVPVEIELSDIDNMVKNGYSVDIDIIDQARADRLCVPSQVVFNDEEGSFVYILSEPGVETDDAGNEKDRNGGGEAAKNGVEFTIVGGFKEISDADGAVRYVQTLFGIGLEKLDSLFPQRISNDPVLIKRPVITGFSGDNGVEILSGLKLGETVVLNP
jgi:multidrug efflux pump subunit AcrA (membrane-fusion protein)